MFMPNPKPPKIRLHYFVEASFTKILEKRCSS
nr:MAG TPA: hypothetical protein [Caudoviricetes sp.]